MLTVSVDTTKAQALLTKALGNVATKINTNEILDKAGAMLLNRMRRRFLAEVDPDNVPWLPSKAAEKRKSGGYTSRGGKKFTSTGTLFESGTLYHSIQLHTVSDTERAISTDVFYGVFHQEGKGQEMRKFLGFNNEDQTMFTKIVQNEVNILVKAELAAIGGA